MDISFLFSSCTSSGFLRLGCGDEFMGKWLCFFMGVLFYWVLRVVCVYHKEMVFFCGEELVDMPNNHSLH